MRDIFGTRLELRLGDPIDSEIDRKVAAAGARPAARAAASWSAKLHFLGALPRIDGDAGRRRPSATASRTSSTRSAAAWTGPTRPEAAAAARADHARRRSASRPRRRRSTTSGCCSASTRRSSRRSASTWPPSRTCWSSATASRARARCCARYIQEIVRTRTPKEAQIVVVDYRRSLLGEVPEEYQLDYLTSATQADAGAEGPRELPRATGSPGPTSPPSSCATARGGPGAEVYVLVDDYDLVATQQGSPIAAARSRCWRRPATSACTSSSPAAPAARRGRCTSRCIQTMRDLAMPGLLLSGSPDEGPLLGNLRPMPGRRAAVAVAATWRRPLQLAWRPDAVQVRPGPTLAPCSGSTPALSGRPRA